MRSAETPEETAIADVLGIDLGVALAHPAARERFRQVAASGDAEQMKIFVRSLIHTSAEQDAFRCANELADHNPDIMIHAMAGRIREYMRQLEIPADPENVGLPE